MANPGVFMEDSQFILARTPGPCIATDSLPPTIMILGHLPAGYLLTRQLFKLHANPKGLWRPWLLAGLAGAVAPDLDMLYFYLVDQRQHHHHSYISHYPLLWGTLLVLAQAWRWSGRAHYYAWLACCFSINGMLHLCLDSIVGDIWWFAPFVDRPFSLFSVPALYQPWWLNFILHWSFALELALVVWAVATWRQSC
jgi:hypothetical protein